MKNYNYYLNEMPIRQAAFRIAVPSGWELKVKNCVYTYGYYKAVELN